jgi:hypothetical protein
LINVGKELHKAEPVVRGKRLVASRVEFATNFVDEITKHGHQSA